MTRSIPFHRRSAWLALVGGVFLPVLGCGEDHAAAERELDVLAARVASRTERAVRSIEVAHILVAFAGTGTKATRSKEAAKTRAALLLRQALGGADFLELMKANSDDTGGGVYVMSDPKKPGIEIPGAMPRSSMVPAFGNVGWRLDVGDIGVAPFNPTTSKFGWHIIKRTR